MPWAQLGDHAEETAMLYGTIRSLANHSQKHHRNGFSACLLPGSGNFWMDFRKRVQSVIVQQQQSCSLSVGEKKVLGYCSFFCTKATSGVGLPFSLTLHKHKQSVPFPWYVTSRKISDNSLIYKITQNMF